MDRKIFKYELPIRNEVTIDLPAGAVPLSVGAQTVRHEDGPSRDCLVLWAAVDTERKPVPHRFFVRGTGHPMGMARPEMYVGTAQLPSGLVWHVFSSGDTGDGS